MANYDHQTGREVSSFHSSRAPMFEPLEPRMLLSGGPVFGPQQVISTAADGANSVYATDLDGDGDADVLSASYFGDKIVWYENLGAGSFSSQKVISTAANAAYSVYATDLDGDGDVDVLSASANDDKIAWYENLGSGNFSSQKVISTAANAPNSVYATDLDGDGDADVLWASYYKIAWYENLGAGSFSSLKVISTATNGALSVYATDLDGDGDADVLSASANDDKIAWYENLGAGSFSTQKIISTTATGARSVYATDLDGDGDADVLSASANDDKIAWYENLGAGSFSTQKVISTTADYVYSVYATDLDGDGDADVLSASYDKVAWYENLGAGSFSTQKIISTATDGATSVYATDLDGDGDADVLSASYYDDKIAWYENLTGVDTTPPVSDPSTWQTEPYATGPTSISMAATMAHDSSGVEYYFQETSGNPGGSNSGWQDSRIYEDTGLSPNTSYSYQVRTRDKSSNKNEGSYSGSRSATSGYQVNLDSKGRYQYNDADGDLVTITLSKGGTGTLLFANNPFDENCDLISLSLSGTNVKSYLTFKTKRAGNGDGLTTVGKITGSTPLKKLSGKKIILIGDGIVLTGSGYIGSVYLHSLTNGADIIMAGTDAPKGVSIKITESMMGGTDIILGSYLKSLSAKNWMEFQGSPSLVTPWASKIAIKYELGADLLFTGANPKNGVALSKLSVGTQITDSVIIAMFGSVGTISAGQWNAGSLNVTWARTILIKGKRGSLPGNFGATVTLTGQNSRGISLNKLQVAGEILGSQITLNGGAGTIKAGQWNAGSLNAAWAKTIMIKGKRGSLPGNFGADLSLTGQNSRGISLNKLQVAGEILGSQITLFGGVGTILAGQWNTGSLNAAWARTILIKGKRGSLNGDFGATVNLTGQDSRGISLNKLQVAGEILGSQITLFGGAGTIKAGQWNAGSLNAAWAKTIMIKGKRGSLPGNFGADLSLTGVNAPKGYAFKTIKVAGEASGTWAVTGNGSTVQLGASSADWTATINGSGNVKYLKVKGYKDQFGNKVQGDLAGSWTGNSVRSVLVYGNLYDAQITLNQVPDLKNLALRSLTVKGWIGDDSLGTQTWILTNGNIGSIKAGGIRNSSIIAANNAAGYSQDVQSPLGGIAGDGVLDLLDPAEVAGDGTRIKSLKITGIRGVTGDFVSNSTIAASEFGTISLRNPETDNGGSPFGISADFISKLTIKDADGTETFRSLDLVSDSLVFDDAEIRLV